MVLTTSSLKALSRIEDEGVDMSGIEKIAEAEAQVADRQEALATLQSGLQRAESVAVAAEDAKRRSEQALTATVVLVAVSIFLLIVGRRNN